MLDSTFPIYYAPRKIFGGAYSRRLVRPSWRPGVRPSHSCPAHKFVIWSRISKLFHRNDHHVETTCRAQHLGRYLEGQGHSATLQQNRVQPITLLFRVGFWKYFTEMITILRQHVARNIWVATLKVKVTAWPCSKIVSGQELCYLKSDFEKYFTEMITILRWRVARKFGNLPWRSRSQRDLAAKSCPAYNFLIWSWILKIFHRNDHHIETICRAQHLGRYLEGQGHSMTLQHNRVRPITLLFEVWFRKIFHRNDHHIETTCPAQHLGRYLEGQGHSMTLQQKRVGPITL